MSDTSTNRPPITPVQAYPIAMQLLTDLGQVIGDRDGIQRVIARLCHQHAADAPRIALSALAWTFAEHVTLDPAGPRHTPTDGEGQA